MCPFYCQSALFVVHLKRSLSKGVTPHLLRQRKISPKVGFNCNTSLSLSRFLTLFSLSLTWSISLLSFSFPHSRLYHILVYLPLGNILWHYSVSYELDIRERNITCDPVAVAGVNTAAFADDVESLNRLEAAQNRKGSDAKNA